MYKYVEFKKVVEGNTIYAFQNTDSENVEVSFFTNTVFPIVALKGTKAKIDKVIEAQDERIECKELGYDEFIAIAKNSDQYKREMEVINAEYEAKVAELDEHTPLSEKDTWDKQQAQAEKYLANPEAETLLIDEISEGRGVSKEKLVAKIIKKAEIYERKLGKITGQRQKKEDELWNS